MYNSICKILKLNEIKDVYFSNPLTYPTDLCFGQDEKKNTKNNEIDLVLNKFSEDLHWSFAICSTGAHCTIMVFEEMSEH